MSTGPRVEHADTLGTLFSLLRCYGRIREGSLAGADSHQKREVAGTGWGRHLWKKRGHFTPRTAQTKHSGRREDHSFAEESLAVWQEQGQGWNPEQKQAMARFYHSQCRPLWEEGSRVIPVDPWRVGRAVSTILLLTLPFNGLTLRMVLGTLKEALKEAGRIKLKNSYAESRAPCRLCTREQLSRLIFTCFYQKSHPSLLLHFIF